MYDINEIMNNISEFLEKNQKNENFLMLSCKLKLNT